MFANAYEGLTVLVTGHTGFKGSWLVTWLLQLKARVIGYSAYHPSEPSHFQVCGLSRRITDVSGDVRDEPHLRRVFDETGPAMVFHLAAQPIVRRSYEEPKLTFDTNVGGTVNVLECVRTAGRVRAIVVVTSDKCYENMKWPWGYREVDRLGGRDPYSASKACAELVCHSYARSLFDGDAPGVRLATARAGNVIGGGDWATDRIIPDCVRAWSKGGAAAVRNPEATRPWQHVLEPLSGYLWLGAQLLTSPRLHGEAFNFGPPASASVSQLIEAFRPYWDRAAWRGASESGRSEDALLQLTCEKARDLLGWHTVLPLNDAARLTAEWYRAYYGGHPDMLERSAAQIDEYTRQAAGQRLRWTGGARDRAS
jgi:CDP-glucose 4,6-dehydratase